VPGSYTVSVEMSPSTEIRLLSLTDLQGAPLI